MSKSRLILSACVALLLLAGTTTPADEAQLLAVLKSEAPQQEKAEACRQLAHLATKDAVPVLAGMLGDEKLSHMARYAMETIADPSADEALREAAGKLKGRPLVGVITSLGVRKDAKAVPALAGMLASEDAEVASAAARALGSIAAPEAAEALTAALGKAQALQRLAVCEGLLRCAEAMLAAGQGEKAAAAYDRIRAVPDAAHQVRTAALRGAVLARGEKDGLPILLEALRDKDYALFAAAVRAARELTGAAVTTALATELPKLGADRQGLVVQALGGRGDAAAAAGPALVALAREAPADVRPAAVVALTRLGYGPAVALLTELAQDKDPKLAALAQQCLGNFPGKEGQAAVMAMLDDKDAKVRRMAVELIGRRTIPGSTAILLKAAQDANSVVRAAGLKVLRDVAGADELPALLGLLVQAKADADTKGAEEALRALCARQATSAGGNVVILKAVWGDLPKGPQADVTKKLAELVKAGSAAVEASNANFSDPAQGKTKQLRVEYTINGIPGSATAREGETVTFTAKVAPPAFVEAFCAAMPKAPVEARAALLRILRSAGGPVAFKAVSAATEDADPKIKDAALRALCDWPTVDALPALTELAKTSKDAALKILALRGYIRLAAQQAAEPAKVVESLKDAMALAGRDEEKRLVLGTLGNIPSVDALTLVAASIDSKTLGEEACLAAVAIAEKIAQANPEQVAKAMEQVAKRTANKDLIDRAEALAAKVKKP
jgi:HEAT repeat protein